MLKLGSGTINKVMLGSTEINKVYLGSTVVYEGGGPPPPAEELIEGFEDLIVDGPDINIPENWNYNAASVDDLLEADTEDKTQGDQSLKVYLPDGTGSLLFTLISSAVLATYSQIKVDIKVVSGAITFSATGSFEDSINVYPDTEWQTATIDVLSSDDDVFLVFENIESPTEYKIDNLRGVTV